MIRPSTWPIERKAAVGFLVAFVLLLGINFSNFYYNREIIRNAGWVNHSHDVLGDLNRLWAALLDAESGLRGYVITGSTLFLDSYDAALGEAYRRIESIGELVGDNPVQAQRARLLRPLVDAKVDLMSTTMELRRHGRAEEAARRVASGVGKQAMDKIRRHIRAMASQEDMLLKQRAGELNRTTVTALVTMGGGSLLQLLLFGIVIVLFRRDLAARNRVQRSLESLTNLQKAVLDSTNYAMISTAPDGTIQSFNLGAERLLGFSAAEVVGRMTPEPLHKGEEIVRRASEMSARLGIELRPGFGALVAGVKPGAAEETEWTYVRKDGGEVPVRLSITTIEGENGQPGGYLFIASDITERRRALEQLGEAMRERQNIMEAVPDIVVMFDRTGRLMRWNRNLELVTGLSAKQCWGKLATDFFRPEDRSAVERFIRESGRMGPGRTDAQEIELPLRARDGRLVPYQLSSAPLRDEGGKLIGITAVGRDITTRKQAEEALRTSEMRFRTVAAVAPVGIYQTDTEGNCLYVNPEWERITGLPAAEAIRDGWTIGVHPEDVEKLEAAWTAFCAAGTIGDFEFRFVRSGGEIRRVRSHAAAIRSLTGKITGYVGTFADITQEKELYERLEQAKLAAEQASRAKGEFLANMSHEIRTPLNGVIGMATLLLDTQMTAQQRDFAETIGTSAESLLTLLNDILDLSKVEAGMLKFEQVEFNVRETVEEAASVLAPRATGKRINLVATVNPGVPGWLKGDPGRLRQVMLNLMGNAVKFTGQGEVVVRVEISEEDESGVLLRCAVSDTGIGISEEARQRLFTPFMQADGSTTRKFGGTGLGLAISRELVERMGGQIGVESELGRGSTFWFTARFARAAQRPVEETSARNFDGLRMLLIDESEIVLTDLADQLSAWGVTVETRRSGVAALERIDEACRDGHGFDGVLFDINLPDMNGVQFGDNVSRIRGTSATKLFLMTALDFKADPETLRAAGIHAEVRKPIKQSQLFDAVSTVAGQIRAGTKFRQAPIPAADPSKAPLRILVAEDNPVNQQVILHLLKRAGHLPEIVENGVRALELVCERDFDVVFMDCQMPEMDGYTAAARIRELEGSKSRIPIVALTAHSLEGDRERCLAAGMDEYLSKPIRVRDLDRVLSGLNPSAAGGVARADKGVLDSVEAMGPGILRQLVELFVKHTPGYFAEATRGLESADSERVRRAIHTLRGSCGSLGGMRLEGICHQLEAAAARGSLAGCEALLAEAEAEYVGLREELESRVAGSTL